MLLALAFEKVFFAKGFAGYIQGNKEKEKSMKIRRSAAAIALAMTAMAPAAFAQTCDESYLGVNLVSGESATFTVQVADTAEERSVGLSGATSIASDGGMLFAYDSSNVVSYWMAETAVALDMIFVDSSGIIAKIHADAVPYDETPISSEVAVQYVLEIAAGQSDALGISVGDQIISPVVGTGCGAASETASTLDFGSAPLIVD